LMTIGIALQMTGLTTAARYRLMELVTEIALGHPHEDVSGASDLAARVSECLDALGGVLVAQLSSEDARVRLDVVEVISTRNGHRDLKALVRALLADDEDEKVRNRANTV